MDRERHDTEEVEETQERTTPRKVIPRKYTHTMPDRAYRLALLGLTDVQIADAFGVDESTLNYWKHDYPELYESLQKGKAEADGKVAESLYKRALGFDIEVKETRLIGDKVVETKKSVKHFPPCTTACIFWLKNRQKAQWRDVYRQEITGKDGGPVQTRGKLDLSGLSDEALTFAEEIGLQMGDNGSGKGLPRDDD